MLRSLLPLPWTLLFMTAATNVTMAAPVVPNLTLIPGDALTSDSTVMCAPEYTSTVRQAPTSVKNLMFKIYGIRSRVSGASELDHDVSVGLGDNNTIRNLWPEAHSTKPQNAEVKITLHRLMCRGIIATQQAQHAVVSNRAVAYIKYTGPLPGINSTLIPPTPPLPTATRAIDNYVAPHSGTPAMLIPPTPPLPTITPAIKGRCPADAPVKVSRSGMYYLPRNDPHYARTYAIACLPNAASAHQAGYRGAGR